MTTFTWTINNYSLRPSYNGAYMKSATFSSDVGNCILWCLEIQYTQSAEICLRLVSPGKTSSVYAYHSLSLLNNLRKEVFRTTSTTLFHKDGTSDSHRLPSLNEDLLVSDVLIIMCEVKHDQQENPSIKVPPCSIIQDLNILLKEEILTDVTLKTEECNVSAHRAILSVRSKVFAAMFKHKTQEQETGCVEIQDVSAELLKQMIEFIYTGKVEDLSAAADLLLPVADKYDLNQLKLLCEESLISTLTINSAARRLILGDLYHAGQLKNHVLTFIKDNLSAVMQTESGKALLRSHPNLVEELLIVELCEQNDSLKKTEFTWAIHDYPFQPSYNGACIRSANFSSDIDNDVLWCLEIQHTQNTELRLRSVSPGSDSSVRVSCSLSLLNNFREKVYKTSTTTTFCKDSIGSNHKLPSLNENLLVNNMLIVMCELKHEQQLTIFGEKPEEQEKTAIDVPAIKVPPCSIIQDLNILLKEEILTDVTLKTEECSVSAHRAILSVRSKVFAAMFKHKTQEQETGCVEIQDVSSESLKQMIEFIYTGKVEDLSAAADLLLSAADKYDLNRLKLLCEESLISTLTINTAARRLILGDLYHAGQLKNHVLTFIRDHLSAVMQTESGKALLRSHPNLVEELLTTK